MRRHGGFSIRSPKTAANKNGRPVIKDKMNVFERVEGINMSSKPETASHIDYAMQPSINSNYSRATG